MFDAASPPRLSERPFRWLQIAMLIGSILLLVAWVVTSFYIVMFPVSARRLVHLRDGGVWITSSPGEMMTSKVNLGTHVVRHTSDRVFPSPGIQAHWTVIPFWALLVPLTCALVLIRVWTMPVRRKDRCRHCGYDMRASPGKCPECGN